MMNDVAKPNEADGAVRVLYSRERGEITLSFCSNSSPRKLSGVDGVRFKVDFLASKEPAAAAWLVGTAVLAALEIRTPGGIGLRTFSVSHADSNNAVLAALDARIDQGDAAAQYLKATLYLSECLRTRDETFLAKAKQLLNSAGQAGNADAAHLISNWTEVEAEHKDRIRRSDR